MCGSLRMSCILLESCYKLFFPFSPKDKRKDAFKTRKERLDLDQSEREKLFLEKLHETHEVRKWL